MEQSPKMVLLLLSMGSALAISGCFGNSKASSVNNETPLQVGNEDDLALPPE